MTIGPLIARVLCKSRLILSRLNNLIVQIQIQIAVNYISLIQVNPGYTGCQHSLLLLSLPVQVH